MIPFNREKAAQYYIVAWVKDWRMHVYLNAIGIGDMKYDEIHALYPWLPPPNNTHMYFKNCLIRAWTSVAMHDINNRLWDTDDNTKRLSLAKRVETWDSTGAKPGTIHNQDKQERRAARKQIRQSGLEYKVSISLMRKGNGHHWSVCK